MSIKRILLPVNGRDDVSEVVHLAFDVARMVDAEVEVLHPYVPYYDAITTVGEAGSAAQIARDIELARSRFETENAQAKRLFETISEAHADIKTSFVEMAGRAHEIVMRRAFSSDLIVIGNANSFDSVFWRDVYDGALIHSARPVLVAPTKPRTPVATDEFASDVLIAWNGTAESARAVSAAEPFFANADQVRILTIGDDAPQAETAEQMRVFANLHGANASVRVIEAGNKSVAEVLLEDASATPGTLLVMGAYSHARWRERLFGGVTQDVLHQADVPVLMAH
ncbi:MAG: universal stress protein [Hyphomicrobiaceae bacterium]